MIADIEHQVRAIEGLTAIEEKLPALVGGRLPVVLPPGGGGLTDDELRASPLEVTGAVAVSGNVGITGSVTATGPLTDTQLRANAVPVSLASVPSHAVTGPITDAQLRAAAVSVSLASVPSHAVTGPLTNAELRAAAVPVTMSSGTPFTFVSAKTVAPTASAVQCDTGALTAGDYELEIQLVASDTVAVGKGLVVEHRNAANNANINVLGGCTAGETVDISIARITIATNERIRVIAGTAAGAASSMYISAIGRRIA